MSTLNDVRLALGDRIDSAVSSLGVPPSEFSDLADVIYFEDTPRVLYFWSIKPDYERVVDIYTKKDFDAMIGSSTEMIPHEMSLQIIAFSAELLEVEEIAQALLSGLGRSPCIDVVPFYYTGITSAAGEFSKGIFTRTLKYQGWLWLPGITVSVPLVQQVNIELGVTTDVSVLQQNTPTSEEGDPAGDNEEMVGDISNVAVEEIIWNLTI